MYIFYCFWSESSLVISHERWESERGKKENPNPHPSIHPSIHLRFLVAVGKDSFFGHSILFLFKHLDKVALFFYFIFCFLNHQNIRVLTCHKSWEMRIRKRKKRKSKSPSIHPSTSGFLSLLVRTLFLDTLYYSSSSIWTK